MSVLEEETINRIKSLLRHYPKGMMISDLSFQTKINRNIMAKYLEILLMAGQVEMETRGNAKVYTLSKRAPLSALFESSSDCIVLLDGNRKILWVNAPVLALTGKKATEFTGKALQEIDDPFFANLPFLENPESGEPITEISVQRNEAVLYYRVKQVPAVLADGSTGSILSCEDVTSEVIFKQMVELSEARFRAIVEDQTEFIARFLPDGTLTFANGSFARAVGKKPEELIGTQFFRHIHPDDVPLFTDKIQSPGPDHTVVTLRCRGTTADGQVLRLQWSVRALFDPDNNLTEYQGVGRDITEQAEAVAHLRRHADEMEFISRKAREFLELPHDADIYVAIAEGLSGLLPDAIVTVSSIVPSSTDPGSHTLTIRNVCGMSGREIFRQISGIDPVGFSFSFNDPATIEYIKMEGLHKAFGDLYSCLFGKVPYLVCKQVEEAINLGEAHIHGLVSQGQVFGEVSIYSRKGDSISNPHLIEVFLQQASLVLAWRMANESLHKSEAQFRTIVEDQTEFIVRFLPDGILTFVNGSYAHSAGKKPEELYCTQFFSFILEGDVPRFKEEVRSLSPAHAVTTIVCRIPCNEGRIWQQQWTVRALFDPDNNLTEYQGVGRDITEEAEAVSRMRRHAADMEFIAKKIRGFMELPPESDIYAAIAEGLSELVPGAVIAVSSITPSPTEPGWQILTIRNVCGIGGRELFKEISGIDLVGFTYSFNDPVAIDYIKMEGLHKAYGDLYSCLFGKVPYLVCRQIEEAINLGDTHIHALVSEGQLIGEVAIYSRKGESIPNPGLVEAFLQQASLVLAWRMANEGLQKSEAQFRAIVEDQTEFIARFLPDGSLTYVNRSYSRYLGKDPQDLIGQPHVPYITGEVIPLLQERSRESGRSDPVTTVQCRVMNTAGSVRWQEWTVRALPDAKGEIAEFQSVGRDITELHEAEESTRQHLADMEFLSRKAREFLELPPGADIYHAIMDGVRELAQGATVAILSFDPHISAIVNRHVWPDEVRSLFRELTGEDLIGKSLVVNDPDAVAGMKSGIIQRVPGGLYYAMFGAVPISTCQKIEETFEMGDIFSAGMVFRDRLLGVVSIIQRNDQPLLNRNLIETYLQQASIALAQRLDADALRQSEERFRGIIEDQTEFVTRFLPDGTLTFANAPLCRAAGKGLEDLIGQSFFTMIPDDDRQILMTGLQSLTRENPKMTIEHRFMDPEGRTRWFQWTNRAIFNDYGQVVEYDGIGRDVTDLHEASERIRKHPADIKYLSQNAKALARARTTDAILTVTARNIRSLIPDALIGFCAYNPAGKAISFWCLEGSKEDLGSLNHELRQDLTGTAFAFEADPDMLPLFSGKRLAAAPGHIGFFLRSVSPDICTRIGERCNLGRSYLMGLPSYDGKGGTVLVQLKAGTDLQNPELIEAAISQADLALEQLHQRQES